MIDLIKFDRPAQFPKDEILDDNERLARGWMTVEVKDKQGDIVAVDEIKRVLNIWMKRGATMMDIHSNRPVGKGLKWEEAVHPESGKPGILLDYTIFSDYSIDDKVWNEIKEGKRQGLSIGGRAGKKEFKFDDFTGGVGNNLMDIELYEVSPVDVPANQYGNNTAVNYLAKGENMESPEVILSKLSKDLQKGYAINNEKIVKSIIIKINKAILHE